VRRTVPLVGLTLVLIGTGARAGETAPGAPEAPTSEPAAPAAPAAPTLTPAPVPSPPDTTAPANAAPPPSTSPPSTPASPPPPPREPESIEATATDADVPSAPKVDQHRGFYGSAGIGAGLFRATSGTAEDPRRFSGTTLSITAVLGGQPGRAFAFGGLFLYDHVYGLSAEDGRIDGDEPDLGGVGFSLWGLGLFLDCHPFRSNGAHARVELALSTLEVDRKTQADIDIPSGFSFGIAAGYDFELNEDIAWGPLLHLTSAPLSVDEGTGSGDLDVDILVPSLELTGTFR
jgi:hypothetical protein